MKQVDKPHYNLDTYGYVERWASYHYQIREILACDPTSILEVGVGDGVVGAYLKHQTDISYTSIDIAEDLSPDIVGEITKIPCGDATFDLVCAFEVLEHIPFELVDTALKEMVRVARTHVIISVPHFGPPIQMQVKIPFLPHLRFAWKVPFPRAHSFNGEHYWELGKREYPPNRLRTLLKKYGMIENDFIPFENQYHHFFVLNSTDRSYVQ